MSNIKITFLGTNGWYTTKTGNTPCVLVETAKYNIIFDAGNGFCDIDRYINPAAKKAYLFLSHFHLDHITGLHTLAKLKFKKGLTIICHPGGKKILDTVIGQPFTIALKDLAFPVEVAELKEGRHKRFPFPVECLNLLHSSMCFGFRVILGKKIISYCTDTGRCPSLLKLAKDADIFITECAHKPGQVYEAWPHLNPETAAAIAQESSVKKLVLMHFDAQNYKAFKDRARAGRIAQKIFPRTVVAKDGMTLNIKG